MKPTDDVSQFLENGMSTTPRTDAAYFKQGATMYDLAGESKKLETELTAAKKDLVIAHDALDERDRLRAEVERLNGYCEQLHTIIDNNGYPSGTDYAKMTARAEKAEADTARMDWLEKEALEDWGIRSINRDAIDAAMKEASK